MFPSDVDITTRMDETWAVIVPTMREKRNIGSDRVSEPRRVFACFLGQIPPGCSPSWHAFEKLARLDSAANSGLLVHFTTMSRPRGNAVSSLENLPVELLSMVFEACLSGRTRLLSDLRRTLSGSTLLAILTGQVATPHGLAYLCYARAHG